MVEAKPLAVALRLVVLELEVVVLLRKMNSQILVVLVLPFLLLILY